jgi:hypothetical protein
MKLIYAVLVFAAMLLVVSGCGHTDSSPTSNRQTENASGLSQAAIDAQLAVGIGSPYQLILTTQESVEPLLRGDTSKEKLEKVIGANVDRVFAKSTEQVRKEITNYLVRYYIKSKTL